MENRESSRVRKALSRVLGLSVVAALSLPLTAIGTSFATEAVASASGPVPGQAISVPGSQWAPQFAATGADLNLYSNGACLGSSTCNIDGMGTYGPQWQCTELAQRWANVAWGEPAIWMGTAASAWSIGPTLPRPLIQIPNGGVDHPRFGDLLVFASTSFDPSGHIAVVSGYNASAGQVNIVEENWNSQGSASLSINGTTMPPRAWGHDSKNHVIYLPIVGWLRPAMSPSVAASFVSRAYVDLLGRAASSADVSYWSSLMVEGAPAHDVALDIVNSSEFKTHEVSAFYQEYLGRGADPGGLAYWVSMVNNPFTYEQVRSGLEAALPNSTNDQWVSDAYQKFLGRAADSGSLAYWTSQLEWSLWGSVHPANLTRQQAGYDIETSGEGRSLFVTCLYEKFLHRAPDSVGLNYWVNSLAGGVSDQEVIAQFVASGEYVDSTQAPSTTVC